ncbi:oxidoreductase [Flavobacterium sp.]|uniref:sialidase family protein n=1 Tax=Flavobacterium sp. TaxID=239 RepID=UPI002487A410|nr:oxidoreductase [Flavobacterium sp.]MDI1318035.1 oxidoreductase [Flavobacterium sp.]
MKNIVLSLAVFVLCIGCKSTSSSSSDVFKSVAVDTLLNDKISIRAILVDEDKIWYAGDRSRIGYYDLKTLTNLQKTIYPSDDKIEFRSIGQNSKSLFVANIGNPAYIFKVNKSSIAFEKVYTENNEKAFYDSMNFWNEKEGIALGDPTQDCFSILITRDAGKTWNKTACDNLPRFVDGETAFAASNTNICIKGNKTWFVSGGKKSRVFYSADKGTTWQVFDTPIINGQAMTGIFTVDFYNEQIGVIAGGNYDVPNQNSKNKAITYDGGKTWKLIADNAAFGYTSCIQFVPKSGGKQLVSVGASGLYYSANGGNSWKQLHTDATLYTIRFLNQNTAIAAGKDKMVKIEFKK